METLSLTGKRVLITGAAGGVGRAVATRLAAEGALMVIADRDEQGLAVLAYELAGMASTYAGDLAHADDVAGLFGEVDRALGGLDILVGCAGVGSDPLMAFGDESWRDVIMSNLVSYVACTRA